MEDRLLTISQVADQLGVPAKTIRNKLSNGSWPLAPVRIGKALRWRSSDVDRIIDGSIKIPAVAGEPNR